MSFKTIKYKKSTLISFLPHGKEIEYKEIIASMLFRKITIFLSDSNIFTHISKVSIPVALTISFGRSFTEGMKHLVC